MSEEIIVSEMPPIEPGIVKVKVRVTGHNAVLLNRRKALGLSQADVEMRAGLVSKKRKGGRGKAEKFSGFENPYKQSYGLYGEIELLKRWPTEQQRNAVCDVLALSPDEAFPKELYFATGLPQIKRDIEIEAQYYVNFLNQWKELEDFRADPQKIFAREVELPGAIQDALSSLTEREAEVLKLYFGLEESEEMSLREIGEKVGLTEERVRQIKEKAARKLHKNKELKAIAK